MHHAQPCFARQGGVHNNYFLLSWKSTHVLDFHPCPGNPPMFYKVKTYIGECLLSSYQILPLSPSKDLNYIQKIIKHDLVSNSDKKKTQLIFFLQAEFHPKKDLKSIFSRRYTDKVLDERSHISTGQAIPKHILINFYL